MKICLLGSSGFIGKMLCERLRHSHIVIETDFQLNNTHKAAGFFEKHKDFDVVIHAAGVVSGDPTVMMQVNLWGTYQLTRYLEKQEKPFQLIFFSTGAVYGNGIVGHKSKEDDPHAPVDFYGLSKKSAEDILQLASSIQLFSLAIVRLPSVYGPGNNKGVLYKMAESAEINKQINIYGNGLEERNLVDVRDVVAAITLIVDQAWTGTMNIASDESFSILQLARMIQNYYPAKIAYHDSGNRLSRMVLDNTLMKDVTGLSDLSSAESFLKNHLAIDLEQF